MMLVLEDRHLKIIQKILSKYPYTFYAFGSRARGNPKQFSDLDLCFVQEIPLKTQIAIESDFEESDLPYKVDLVNWNTMNDDFKKIIEKDLVLLQEHKI
ncbi:nucleotidyltransferase domain-containing protein [Candidatus Dependentiae bacterium]|nr:nucleotidyltransferase domain-containing protein [Candidatus Dependentiae bacterium]